MSARGLKPDPERNGPGDLWRLATIGIELVVTVAGFVFLGLWLDRRLGHRVPWMTLVGLALGFALGMYRMVWAVLRARK